MGGGYPQDRTDTNIKKAKRHENSASTTAAAAASGGSSGHGAIFG